VALKLTSTEDRLQISTVMLNTTSFSLRYEAPKL